MIPMAEMREGESIYSHVLPCGTNVHIAAARLRLHLLTHQPTPFLVPIDLNLCHTFYAARAIDDARILSLTPHELSEPIILCKDLTLTEGRPDVLFCDGHHRYVRRALDGERWIKAWLVEYADWQPFRIEGHPTLSQESLKAAAPRPAGGRR